MKIKIQIQEGSYLPEIIEKGEWIDLAADETVVMSGPRIEKARKESKDKYLKDVIFDSRLISLGIAMGLPKGFEAVILPRSSTYNKYGIVLANSQGVIDNSFSGSEDIWKFPAIAMRDTKIQKGVRIAQFRIQLSQKATFLQKLRWLFSSRIKIERVSSLNDNNRGGFGSTGE